MLCPRIFADSNPQTVLYTILPDYSRGFAKKSRSGAQKISAGGCIFLDVFSKRDSMKEEHFHEDQRDYL